MKQPIVWTIAGSDTSGGAGIQADIKTFNALGVHGCSIITAMTAQNSQTLSRINHASKTEFLSQLTTLSTPKAIKIGMLGCTELIETLTTFLQTYTGITVLDPVITSSSGYSLFAGPKDQYIAAIKKLFPYLHTITPNILETEQLLQTTIHSPSDIEKSAKQLLSFGVKNVLIKGGHATHDIYSQDYWTNGKDAFWISSKRFPCSTIRGTGCTLSSAIAACLALNYEIKDAIVIAKMFLNQAIKNHYRIDNIAYLAYSSWPENEEDLPTISPQPKCNPSTSFPTPYYDHSNNLGLYPVIDSIEWLKKLLELGITTIQLRIKNQNILTLEKTIQLAVSISNKFKARLFINDHWELAIKYKAYGIHLGQEDLATADLNKIQQAGLRLGISTHCYYEVARAHDIHPSYIACGPIYATTSKIMPFLPQGLTQLHRWRRTLNYPLVAIGGINLERLGDILNTQVNGIALISAITESKDPINATLNLLSKIENHYHATF